MNNDEAIRIHLLLDRATVGSTTYTSTLRAALKDARVVTGRDLNTGLVTTFDPRFQDPGRWLGAVGYFIVLDQIGVAYEDPSVTANPFRNELQRPLHFFAHPPLSKEDIYALYALRNSFAHDYSVVKTARKSPFFLFEVSQSPSAPLVAHAYERWNGDFSTLDPQRHETKINIRAFGDLVEEIHIRLCAMHASSSLRLKISTTDLLTRFTISIRQREATWSP